MTLVCVVGPTGVGKSALAIELARVFDGEIISADSMQIYQGLDVGTGKVTLEEMKGVPHYGLNLVQPEASFTVADFVSYAEERIHDISARGRLPLVVGGTTLYVRGLVDGLDFQHQAKSSALRASLQQRAEECGVEALHAELVRVDPLSANRLHPNDVRRVIRALEVYYITGQPLSASYQWHPRPPRFDALLLGLTCSREELYRRINQRVEAMVQAGWIREVEQLMLRGVPLGGQAMQAIGYRHVVAFLEGKMTMPDMVGKIQQDTRRYAKRQLSFLRQDERVEWLDMSVLNANQLIDVASERIGKYFAGISCDHREYT
ncbi:MAG: tRNA (adenosine(37)-N6)-dimethylallyltransferase MiaA [Alicyclobacillaceae bacterium]|jgi:tRNA dimethylallyltransferase|uniref:tRNA (adenosine(37)-N6)-dimethylallyltransferase MiaA n=1 Tax=Alicyclobacillus sp. SP_1 TaxID=2942475 RepID=UPI0021580763|nr:tRNA (adenosine(37)-N6)-dimethylallyltransferase MiaA [Alicyclobacillus sp. SP_1]MCY0889165.1 tRNA (adenosine(37)-N6)-dimethylallyltransferase MiaA [Alicyclobacillaceae bacterium]